MTTKMMIGDFGQSNVDKWLMFFSLKIINRHIYIKKQQHKNHFEHKNHFDDDGDAY